MQNPKYSKMKIIKKGKSLLLKVSKKEWEKLGKKHVEYKPSEHDEIFEAGRRSAKQGKAKSENPYKDKSEEHSVWNDGFDMGSTP